MYLNYNNINFIAQKFNYIGLKQNTSKKKIKKSKKSKKQKLKIRIFNKNKEAIVTNENLFNKKKSKLIILFKLL